MARWTSRTAIGAPRFDGSARKYVAPRPPKAHPPCAACVDGDWRVVGWVTSGGYAHYVDHSMAQGYVPRELAENESAGLFEIEILGQRRQARSMPTPLFDPSGERCGASSRCPQPPSPASGEIRPPSQDHAVRARLDRGLRDALRREGGVASTSMCWAMARWPSRMGGGRHRRAGSAGDAALPARAHPRRASKRRDHAGILLYDPLNVRYATDSTDMQLWCAHNAVRYAFVAAEGPVILWDFHNCEHLSEASRRHRRDPPGGPGCIMRAAS